MRDEAATYDVDSLSKAIYERRVTGYRAASHDYCHWLVVTERQVVEGWPEQDQALRAAEKLNAHDQRHGIDKKYCVVLRIHDYDQLQQIRANRARAARKEKQR